MKNAVPRFIATCIDKNTHCVFVYFPYYFLSICLYLGRDLYCKYLGII